MAAALENLGPAPADGNDYVTVVAGRFGGYDNNEIGDCVAVDTANSLILRTCNAGAPVIPTVDQVVGLYSAVGGYQIGDPATDNGCSVSDMCAYMGTTGFLGHKSAAHGPVDPTNFDHVKWAQILFGTVRISWNLPGYAEDLFDAGQRWDIQSTGDQSLEGHDTALVDYRDGLFYVVTWYDDASAYPRRIVPVTPAFFSRYAESTEAEVFSDWVGAKGTAPSGFDLATLVSKLGGVGW